MVCTGDAGDSAAVPGSPLSGLTPADLARFQAGKALFQRGFTFAEGLGPLFNQDRCSSCHDLPAVGGSGVETVEKATRYLPPGRCDQLGRAGAVFQDRASPALQALGITRVEVPPAATGRARLDPPALFGLGLIEAIPDQAILARGDSSDAHGNGLSGRAGRTTDGRLGRFGQKADHATLKDFVETALLTEMGLTTTGRPTEEGVGHAALPAGVDPAPEPEVRDDQVKLLVAFVRFLAPPPPARIASFAERDSVRRGRRIFHQLGCAGCHVPEMRTGPSGVSALDRKVIPLYSDLLLHDLGPELADVCGPAASPSEFRTARLLGLRLRLRYLHDGRAVRLEDAILLHGGEARAARDNFQDLSYGMREYLYKFLNSL
ncbi:MAG: hypothetical protein HYW06_12665 [Gemmatimonadetes bacterium]|nr:hypothetical protein [Gemmatimonadota bacterium]